MILVTGGTGLVGSHLLYQLTLENELVFAIYRKNSNLGAVRRVFSYYNSNFAELFKKIKWVEADITDIVSLENVFENITHVYHCAAFVSFNPKDYRTMRKTNIEGTSNVVNCCIAKKIQKLCFVSSIATMDKTVGKKLIDEDCEWNSNSPHNPYAITKYGAEMEVWRASQEGVPVVIVNPGVILGSGFWHLGTGKIFDKIYKGMPFYTEGVTGFVYVEDVIKTMLLLMEKTIENRRFVLVAENISFKEVFSLIANKFSKKPPRIKVTKFMSELVWRLGALKSFFFNLSPILTKHSAKSIHGSYYYSSEKIKTSFDFSFTSVEKSIQVICKQYLQDIVAKKNVAK